ncbi:tail fiber assembly protein, partial [Salmonella enterica]|nr:tail fiber assembly protein [Salmonella enterica]
MMLYYYSAVKNAFFPDELKDAYQDAGNWPQDAAEVEESVFTTYSASPPQGKQRAADKDGLPCWVNIPLPDIEDARSQKHAEINGWRNVQENANYTFTFDNHKWD